MFLSNCVVCGKKKSRFLTNQETKKLELNRFVLMILELIRKINKIVNKFLLAEDKFMPELNLRQPGLTYRAFRPLTTQRKIILFKYFFGRKTGAAVSVNEELALELHAPVVAKSKKKEN